MVDVLHVRPDLMGASCLKVALYEGYIPQTLQYLPMGDGMFALITIGKGVHNSPVFGTSAYMGIDGALIFVRLSPYQSDVSPFDRVVKKTDVQGVSWHLRFWLSPKDLKYPYQFYGPILACQYFPAL